MQLAHRDTPVDHTTQRTRMVKGISRRAPYNAYAKFPTAARRRMHGTIHFSPAMVSHRDYLPSVGFGMAQRRLNFFIWMPSSFHFSRTLRRTDKVVN